MLALALIALVVALAALALAGRLWLAARPPREGDGTDVLPGDVLGLRQEVAALRAETRGSLRHLAIVRYDAFGGRDGGGGQQSWSLALADEAGSGVVLTSISGRSEARSYAKALTAWSSERPLSPEEAEAVAQARP